MKINFVILCFAAFGNLVYIAWGMYRNRSLNGTDAVERTIRGEDHDLADPSLYSSSRMFFAYVLLVFSLGGMMYLFYFTDMK